MPLMLNDRLNGLGDYPFQRLRDLIGGLKTPAGIAPIVMSIGEPQHAYPDMVADILHRHRDLYGKYPPINGTPEYRQAATAWLNRRYNLPLGMLDADRNLIPVAGTKEGLYLIAQAVVPSRKNGQAPLALLPDPFYPVYAGAAAMAGAEAYLMPARRENGFLPDFDSLSPSVLERTAIAYLCSPANPQGTVADIDYWMRLIALARKYDFTVVADECYAEIYAETPPAGALEAAARLGGGLDNLVCFHSLSKRSSVPGLRIGFVAGDARIIAAFTKLRSYGGTQIPLPILHAATALWQDEAHVAENRGLYQKKFALAERILGNRLGFFKPPGGFFLWLDAGDSEAATKKLYEKANVTVLPGAYLAKADDGTIGKPYLRVALVHDLPTTEEGLTRIRDVLG